MAKFKVFENVLNEYVNHPTQVFVEEVEAESANEAIQLVRMMYPHKSTLTVINGNQSEV